MPSQNGNIEFSLPETFMQQVKHARYAAMEEGMRHVTYEISYLLPDHPHVIGLPFTHYIESDYFAVGGALTKRIDDLLKRSATLLDEEKANQIATEFITLSEELKTHLERVQNTAEDFILPFKGLTAAQRKEAIEDVPLKKLREFLQFWEREIDGPLEQVKVGLKKLPPSDLTREFLNTASNDGLSDSKAQATQLIGIKPKKLLLN